MAIGHFLSKLTLLLPRVTTLHLNLFCLSMLKSGLEKPKRGPPLCRPILGNSTHPASCSTQTRGHHSDFPHSLPLIQTIIKSQVSSLALPLKHVLILPSPTSLGQITSNSHLESSLLALALSPPVLHRQPWRSGYS